MTELPPRHLLLLYSGGLDGSYLLQRLSGAGLKVTALNVRTGDAGMDGGQAAHHAAALGAEFLEADATDEFFADFLPAAIHADAFYQGQFPVGSTLTRPLMARTAVAVARRLGCDAIGHTATYMQNSALRITASVAALAPDIDVAAPFLGSDIPREEKLAALTGTGISFPSGIHSIDTNPWSRVIECGTLESPENRLDESVFVLTRPLADTPAADVEVDLAFRNGLPFAMDGKEQNLADMVTTLNSLAGSHGIGRFAGLEDTAFGVKNHEVRESPAAAVLTAAHRALANAVFDTREHVVRAQLATEWTNTVVGGGWFSHLGQVLAHCLAELDRPVTGTVRLRLHRGTVTVVRLESSNGRYYSRLGRTFHDWMNQYSYGPWLSLATLGTRSRSHDTKEQAHE
ncbi:argininosuccinate synthase domain-containing protein [Streptomyces europaeiscabiei]|uniref:argininosuccinate synthase domain-containing protein n=1 Tax=Streptomyces europaeiscabiei TaxID=146819 RepID=UPI0029B8A68C|nr:argininosuccinate synthase domain-containing protein [Streptomyces europaeiscabiei]MDX2525280.1 argininosuccinate synthase [Streptomyces europaeiscabiei]